MQSPTHRVVPALLLSTLLAGGAYAQSAPLPPIQHAGAIAYLSGGIGKDEASAVEHASRHWPLTLEFAVQEGKHAVFTADVQVRVRDAQRHTVLETTTEGPYLLARLPPGHYTVEAQRQGQTRHRAVTIVKGRAARAVFVWPAARPGPRA